ncbi:uncharacterized protein LOC108808018 [Raphanus sativus]|uniref:Uncharacterized protein LOC108808018 n=1 Tax=Raphanus sativus TaxID=3726 RepID=A0A6J0JL40_RAPSA|nr:uncharacterized protein LOC108808018 [Raphanus sativus]
MRRMIEYMPTAWRVVGRVRGIALSRDRFQFIFQREEDLLTVLKDRPWSYNHWTIALERWTADPPPDFLRYMEIWIRIKNIPMKFFTGDTMHRLASEIGHVELVAYDPKVSHTKDYIRVLITFDSENPAKPSRKLTVSKDKTVTVEFEYERIHKKCHHCFRLTHEKFRCPVLQNAPKQNSQTATPSSSGEKSPSEIIPTIAKKVTTEAPPGFPVMFPELPPEERKAALLYISHSDATERQARIMRVRQAIEDQGQSHVAAPARFTSNLDNGKGHVFCYPESDHDHSPPARQRARTTGSLPLLGDQYDQEGYSKTEGSGIAGDSAPNITTGFQIGMSSQTPSAGDSKVVKVARRRPPSWKRKAQALKSTTRIISPSDQAPIPPESGSKRKTESASMSPSKKSSTPTTNSVASGLKPLHIQ